MVVNVIDTKGTAGSVSRRRGAFRFGAIPAEAEVFAFQRQDF